jgi:hypothetical protein
MLICHRHKPVDLTFIISFLIPVILKDALNISDYTACYDKAIKNSKKLGRKWTWTNLRHYLGTSVKRLGGTMKDLLG